MADTSDLELLATNFDRSFYLARYPQIAAAGDDPVTYYTTRGWREGQDPAAWFSTRRYLEDNPDVAQAGVEPFLHYLRYGRFEGRVPYPGPDPKHISPTQQSDLRVVLDREFDTSFYRAAYEDIAALGLDPIQHYLSIGWREGRDPAPWFSTRDYLAQNPDVEETGTNPFVHYLLFGRAEGRRLQSPEPMAEASSDISDRRTSRLSTRRPTSSERSLCDLTSELSESDQSRLPDQPAPDIGKLIASQFDEDFYLATNPDIAAANIDPIRHYLKAGWKELRDPAPWFSTREYLRAHPKLKSAGTNPFVHYLLSDRSLDRSALTSVPRPTTADALDGWEVDLVAPHFDVDFYSKQFPEITGTAEDLILHFLETGWREGADPNKNFSVRYYLDTYPDIRGGNVNPYLHYLRHGQAERRHPCSYEQAVRSKAYEPLVSVVLPNYNHARHLPERFASIFSQTYTNVELIVLDDASTDGSLEIINDQCRLAPFPTRVVPNSSNSGSVFSQWRKGIAAASGQLVWICESDDSCEADLLERLVPYLADPSVMMAFGAIQFIDSDGTLREGLDQYRESAHPGIWGSSHVAPAHAWFRGAFGLRNVIPNVGGCVFRNVRLPDAVWDEAEGFGVCGDWYLYANLVSGGRIAFEPLAVSYFRQHESNTSVRAFTTAKYYQEHYRIAETVRGLFGTSDGHMLEFYRVLRDQYVRSCGADSVGSLHEMFSLNKIVDQQPSRRHVLIAIYAFQLGGGEILPIHLANALLDVGFAVSVFVLVLDEIDESIRSLLDPRVAVYSSHLVQDLGVNDFVRQAGIDLVNTHNVGCDLFFVDEGLDVRVPYVVSHHGSYEIADLTEQRLSGLMSIVDHWVYLADKNFSGFERRPGETVATKLPNAVPTKDTLFEITRADLGIGDEDFVFAIATRALKSKGWEEAILALREIQGKQERAVHLLLCGSGEDLERLRATYSTVPGVHFLGYQENVHGLYRLADCGLLPTRFAGESYPLTLIECLQSGRPAVATDIGEISSILSLDDVQAGVLVPFVQDSGEFVVRLAHEMRKMLDPRFYEGRRSGAVRISERYSMSKLVEEYVRVYGRAAGWRHGYKGAGSGSEMKS